jgi:hypothetical protein
MKPCLNFVTSTTLGVVAPREEEDRADTSPRCCRREEEEEDDNSIELPLYDELRTIRETTQIRFERNAMAVAVGVFPHCVLTKAQKKLNPPKGGKSIIF